MINYYYRELQEEKTNLMTTHAEFEQSLSELQRKILTIEIENSNLKLNIQNYLLIELNYNNKINLLNNSLKLYNNEIISLRKLLLTYDNEFKIGKPKLTINEMEILNNNKLIDLQNLLDLNRNETQNIINEYLTINNNNNNSLQRNTENNVSIEKSNEKSIENTNFNEKLIENENLLKENEKSKNIINKLQIKLNNIENLYENLQYFTKTDFIPQKTKILHLISNPFTNELIERNEIIKQKSTIQVTELKELKLQLKNNQNITQLNQTNQLNETNQMNNQNKHIKSPNQLMNINNAISTSTSTVTSINNNNADSNKLNQRLKEIFSERISSFREAVYLLFGYKVDLYTCDTDNNSNDKNIRRLRLRSMYAESSEDILLFQWNNNTLELLETTFASKLDNKLINFLHSNNSVPAFLANVTMELFENQTFMG